MNENPIKNPEMKDYSLQVELAFRKFDLDRDGFLSWDEFRQVRTFLFILCVLVFCVGLEVTFHSLRSGVLTLTFTCILGLQVGGVLVFYYSDIDKRGLVDWNAKTSLSLIWISSFNHFISYSTPLCIYFRKVKMEENFQLLYSSDGNGAGTGGKDLPVLPYGGSTLFVYYLYDLYIICIYVICIIW